MDFKTTTDRLMDLGVPAREIAEALGLRPNTVRAMRLNPASAHHRAPPANWQRPIERLIRGRSRALDALAEDLRGEVEKEA